MRHSLTILVSLLASLGISAQDAPLWLRDAAVSPDGTTIIFRYKGDLWSVAADGGQARLLTTNEAFDHAPVWSHDGGSLAFASDRSGNDDVYVMPSSGGEARRLTFNSGWDEPSDFTRDGSAILFRSVRTPNAANMVFPAAGLGELFTVPSAGGATERIVGVGAERARYSPDGRAIVFHDLKGYENEYRKHQTSSVARDLWIFDTTKGTYGKLTRDAGEDRDPVFSMDGRTIYFLSERSGSFNVFRMPAGGGTPVQVSFLTDDPVRTLSMSDDGLLCYSYRGELYTQREGAQPQKVHVTIATDDRYPATRIEPVNGEATEMALSPDGKEVAFVHRGEVFVASVAEGTTRRITNTPQQERSVSFSPDGRTLVYAAERDTSWDIYTTTLTRKQEDHFFNATILKEEPLVATPAEEFQPVWSPDGRSVAYLEERTTVRVIDIATKKVHTVLSGDHNYSYTDGDQFFSWSPDSKWLFVEYLHPEQWISQCGLVSVDGGEIVDMTRSGYGGQHPTWVKDGEAMLFFSSRDGLKNHASWGSTSDVYATFLTRKAFDRFQLSKEEADLLKEKEDKEKEEQGKKDAESKDKKKKKGEKEEKEPVKPVKIELDGIHDRKVRLTINTADLAGAVLSKDGEKLFYLASFEKGYDLWETELRTHETRILAKLDADDASDLVLDKEGKELFYLHNGQIGHVNTESGEMKGVGINGEMIVNGPEERAYLFEHVWRQMLKKFYRVDMQGVDWRAYRKEYERFLPYINNPTDLAEMFSEMLGEMNASHTGAGYRRRDPNGDATASLGLLYADDPALAGLRVTEVLDRGPAVQEGSRIRPGVVIEKIDGNPIANNEDASRLLNRKAGKPTLLSLYDPGRKVRWEETLKPVTRGEEYDLLYHRWVERCRHQVDSLSHGRLGYVHVEGMNDASYRTVFEEVLGRYPDRDGLIVDTRFNGGGWLHDDLATFLSGHTYMHFLPRGQKLGTEPEFKWQKASCVVMNEGNYSDAHMFPVTYRALDIGKLVGMPVPGTGTAVWWERLQNGMFFGIPQVGMVDNNGNYLENQQLEPDVEQPNEPGVVTKGFDQQLDAAVKVLMAQ
ncbi:MAG: PD40 domain-containing protein [Flavobacteriales bacterium]|nr:PD40 domain-containing protein [Flavobacteriales bacterium]